MSPHLAADFDNALPALRAALPVLVRNARPHLSDAERDELVRLTDLAIQMLPFHFGDSGLAGVEAIRLATQLSGVLEFRGT